MASSQETMSTGVDFFFFLAEQHLRYSLLRSRAYGKEKMLVDMQQHKKLVDITLLRLEFPSCPLDVGLAVLEVLADRHVLPAEETRAAMVTTTTTATKNEHLPRPCSANNLN
uniref:Uncharacterized protein n=1 Tax=Oryza glumipatula TaxID=40148 RepID=A0A0E0B6V2_9ORYZ